MKPNTLRQRLCFLAFAAILALTSSSLSAGAPKLGAASDLTQRLIAEHGAGRIKSLTGDQIVSALTAEEREAMRRDHIGFTVDQPSFITVYRSDAGAAAAYWLKDRGFTPTDEIISVNDTPYRGFRRAFDPGDVSLGIGAWDEHTYPYFVTVQPTRAGVSVDVSGLIPDKLRTARLVAGAQPFVDRDPVITAISPGLGGSVLVRTSRAYARDVSLLGRLLVTPHPASTTPDHIVLTPGADPKSQIVIQWRTSPAIGGGVVALRTQKSTHPVLIAAQSRPLHTPDVINDPTVHLHTTTLDRLQPGISYEYCIGNSVDGPWTA